MQAAIVNPFMTKLGCEGHHVAGFHRGVVGEVSHQRSGPRKEIRIACEE